MIKNEIKKIIFALGGPASCWEKAIKECYFPSLPYLNNVDKFIDEILYKGKPSFLSKLWRKFIKNPKEQKNLRNKKT